eukprot:scaffold8842_cov74-Cyclotella_meneghiniana.AAC.1
MGNGGSAGAVDCGATPNLTSENVRSMVARVEKNTLNLDDNDYLSSRPRQNLNSILHRNWYMLKQCSIPHQLHAQHTLKTRQTMADDADRIDRLEQQINGAIIDTVVSNLVSQIARQRQYQVIT